LFDRFDRALDVLGEAPKTDGAVDIDTRVEELTTFIEGTQAHLDEIERRAIAFSQLKTKLGERQSRLAPREAENGGVVSLVDELRQKRDRLFSRMRQIEEDDDGGLAERVKKAGAGGSRRQPYRAIRQAGDDPQRHRRPVQ